jgi:glycosyltransferase involved in cell wall biosynthesis
MFPNDNFPSDIPPVRSSNVGESVRTSSAFRIGSPAAQKNAMSLSVFFPCHNEEGNVERVTRSALDVLATISPDYEVIIVNDGSSDRTADIANRLAAEHVCVRVVHHRHNQGYGAALRSGFRAATKEWVFYTDGDGQFDLNELPRLVTLASRADIVSGYRTVRRDSWLRSLNAMAWGLLIGVTLRLWVRDVDCAFKLYRREIFDHIEIHSTGALIDAEILARAQRCGYTIVQTGVCHHPRICGTQSGARLKVITRAFWELFRLRKSILKQPRTRPRHQ